VKESILVLDSSGKTVISAGEAATIVVAAIIKVASIVSLFKFICGIVTIQ
jgi:hypothetical protein